MKHSWLGELLQNPDCVSGSPLVELIGNNRLLIENHQGVIQYGTQEIGIKTKLGCIYVVGDGLTLLKMTKEQLVIVGTVYKITLKGVDAGGTH